MQANRENGCVSPVGSRRDPRYRFGEPQAIQAHLTTVAAGDAQAATVEIADLSDRGARVVTDQPLQQGGRVSLTIRVPALDLAVTLAGQVRWSKMGPRAKWHVGCFFETEFPPAAIERLAEAGYLERRADVRQAVALAGNARIELDKQSVLPILIVDYSSGGLRLALPGPTELEQRLLLEVVNAAGQPVSIPLRPLWQRQAAGCYHLGCGFLSDQGHRALMECLPAGLRPHLGRAGARGARTGQGALRRRLGLAGAGAMVLVVGIAVGAIPRGERAASPGASAAKRAGADSAPASAAASRLPGAAAMAKAETPRPPDADLPAWALPREAAEGAGFVELATPSPQESFAADAPAPELAAAADADAAAGDAAFAAADDRAAILLPAPPDFSSLAAPAVAPLPNASAEESRRAAPTGESPAEPLRTWTDNTGRFRIRARLVAIGEGRVHLLKENGSRCTVPLRRLSEADQQYLATTRPAVP